VDQVRKSYPKLRPTDSALLASAIALTGRHAIAVFEGQQYRWPDEYPKLTEALAKELEVVQSYTESPKKVTKSTPEEEPIVINVGLMPNFSAGERILEGRKNIKALLSEVLQGGVEFVYSSTDVGWQWALDRANWSTISGGEVTRKIKVKAVFTEGAVGVEMGSAKRKRPSKAKPEKETAEVEEAEAAEAE